MRTKKDIQQEALRLFSRYGLKSVNMDDISFHLGISKKTLYQVFNSKEELILSLFDHTRAEWDGFIRSLQVKNLDPIQKLIKFYTFRYEFIVRLNPLFILQSGKYYETIQSLYEEIRTQVDELVLGLLSEARDQGFLKEGIDIRQVCMAHSMLFDFFLEKYSPVSADSAELFRHLFIPHISGLLHHEKASAYKSFD